MKYNNFLMVLSFILFTNSILLSSEGNIHGYGSFRRYTPKSRASSDHERHFQEFYDDLDDNYDVNL